MDPFKFSIFYVSVMTSVKEKQQLFIINTFHTVRKMLCTINYLLSKRWKRLKRCKECGTIYQMSSCSRGHWIRKKSMHPVVRSEILRVSQQLTKLSSIIAMELFVIISIILDTVLLFSKSLISYQQKNGFYLEQDSKGWSNPSHEGTGWGKPWGAAPLCAPTEAVSLKLLSKRPDCRQQTWKAEQVLTFC